MNFIEIAYKPSVGGLTKLIADLITSFPAVWVGIIVFTVLLKLVTLIFDYFSRSSMRKSSLKMKQMRPELEKLQEQYKDRKDLYSQKVMALYKKEGYSVFGSCLPTIVTLVIFIIVLNSFNSYSTFQQEENLYNMAAAYNHVVIDGIEADGADEAGYYVKVEKNKKTKADELIFNADAIEGALRGVSDNGAVTKKLTKGEETYELTITKGVSKTENGVTSTPVTLSTQHSYVTLKITLTKDADGKVSYTKDDALFGVDLEQLKKNETLKFENKTFAETYEEAERTVENAEKFVVNIQQRASADVYYKERQSFFWVKNIWKPDAVYSFSGCTRIVKITPVIDNNKVLSNDDYKLVIGDLSKESKQPNGYYILIVLTIGTMILSQLVSMKSQKDQLELQTVDGQGAQTQKMMMWMMPVMMAFFAFIYSAAFSLYIIVSTLMSTITTVIINKIVDARFAKKEGLEENNNIVRRG
ncbi:MAG: hypothetical protein HP008_05460 [Clostridia bacterium]|nr:hypothetical protein [Clostridia bacterium]